MPRRNNAPYPVSVRVSEEELEALDSAASVLGLRRSEFIRLMLFGEKNEHRDRGVDIFKASDHLKLGLARARQRTTR